MRLQSSLGTGGRRCPVGTRFIASKECIAHSNYKDIIVQAAESGRGLVDMGRFRIRALLTPLVEKLTLAGILPAGRISRLVREVLTVKEIIEGMVN